MFINILCSFSFLLLFVFIFFVCALFYVVCVVCICQHLEWIYWTREKVVENFPQLCTNSIVFFCLFVAILHWLLFNNYSSSLRASSPIWTSEVSSGRTRERAAKPRGTAPRFRVSSRVSTFHYIPKWRACSQAIFPHAHGLHSRCLHRSLEPK